MARRPARALGSALRYVIDVLTDYGIAIFGKFQVSDSALSESGLDEFLSAPSSPVDNHEDDDQTASTSYQKSPSTPINSVTKTTASNIPSSTSTAASATSTATSTPTASKPISTVSAKFSGPNSVVSRQTTPIGVGQMPIAGRPNAVRMAGGRTGVLGATPRAPGLVSRPLNGDSPIKAQRIVVVRQATPTGTVYVGHPAPMGTPTSLTNGRGGRTTLLVRSAGPMRGRVLTRGAVSTSPGRAPIYVHRTNGGTGVRLLRPVGSSPQIHTPTGHQYIAGSSGMMASPSAQMGGPRILRQAVGRGITRGGPVGPTRGVFMARGSPVRLVPCSTPASPIHNYVSPSTPLTRGMTRPRGRGVLVRGGASLVRRGSETPLRYGLPSSHLSLSPSNLAQISPTTPLLSPEVKRASSIAQVKIEPKSHMPIKVEPRDIKPTISFASQPKPSMSTNFVVKAEPSPRMMLPAPPQPQPMKRPRKEPPEGRPEIDFAIKAEARLEEFIEVKPAIPRLEKLEGKKIGRPRAPKGEKKMKDDKLKVAPPTPAELEDELEENMGYADTYSEYQPAKLRSGLAHPDCVVETASLSSVQPPEIRYHCSIPEESIDTGAISALQLEAVIYGCQMHEARLPSGERTGYLIGDGAGVGKGRTVACIIFENYLLGRKRALWLSVSADLKYDAERDLRDIGAGRVKVYALNKFKYAKISGKENGSVKRGVIFATYSSLIGECRTAKSKYRSRLKQLIQWCGRDFDGAIIFDECHRAKNLVPTGGSKPTKTGRVVLELQRALPNARVVYASATGATEPRNMAYMTRLGLWGKGQPFPEFGDFINAVERRGVGAMEIVAMDMKQRGLYLARQLSFRGVSFRIEEIALTPSFIEMYDESVKLWLEARRQFQAASNMLTDEQRQQTKQMWGQFWAAHQRFFKYLCIGAKVEACVNMSRDAVKNGKCIVIGLQSTGEARTLEQLDDCGGELTDFVSTAKAVFLGLIDKHFPTGDDKATYSSGDIFRDFDKMVNNISRPSKRKLDVFEDITGGSHMKRPYVKRRKRNESGSSDDTNKSGSSGSESESDVNDGESRSESESTTESDDDDNEDSDGQKSGDEKDWLKTLFAEAQSSGDEESDSSEAEDNDDNEEKQKVDSDTEAKDNSKRTDDEDSFNPFAAEFADDDPWASKQQVVEDSPEKKKRKNRKKLKMLKKKRQEKKEKREQHRMEKEREKIKEELQSEAQQGTAEAFLASSRIISVNEQQTGGCLNLNRAAVIKAELMAAIERLGDRLPPNTLDQLIDELGGPDYVAEMTGRKGRVVSRDDGEIEYELRHAGTDVPLELMNMDEKEKFMRGEKLIAVISEAASSGISLQSDRRVKNQRRRVHITLELPWSADKAIQQFGRTHRSNQVNAPEYVFMISELAGEKRFASIVAKRLESLGALTHGDRRATESRDLSQFNLDTKYGRSALDSMLKSITGQVSPPLIPPPADYKPGNFIEDMRKYMEGVGMLNCEGGTYTIEREASTIPKFLNRLLGLPVHAQNALFQYFADTVTELLAQAKRDGTFDMGIMDLGMGGDHVRKLETRVFMGRIDKGNFRVEMHKIGVERGVNWSEALEQFAEHNSEHDGFYESTVGINGKLAAALIYAIGKKRLDSGARLFCVTRPNTGRSPKLETFAEIKKRFRKIPADQAESIWNEQYDGSNTMCQHTYFHGRCRNELSGLYCETGRRTRTYFVLSGSVLSVWPVVEDVLEGNGGATVIGKRISRMQVIRVKTEQDQKIVGLLVLPQYVRELVQKLEEHCGRSYLQSNTDNKTS
uniref:Uncharacterized protein n=1 Tax=Plectus sambesii TaxID=2011161 RepID=A0A914W791_9BILA